MKKTRSQAKRPKNYRIPLLAKKPELSSSLRTKLDALAGPGGAALEDLVPVFYDQFIALRINGLDYLQLKLIEAALDDGGWAGPPALGAWPCGSAVGERWARLHLSVRRT